MFVGSHDNSAAPPVEERTMEVLCNDCRIVGTFPWLGHSMSDHPVNNTAPSQI